MVTDRSRESSPLGLPGAASGPAPILLALRLDEWGHTVNDDEVKAVAAMLKGMTAASES